MSVQIAQTVCICAAVVGMVVWYIGFRSVSRIGGRATAGGAEGLRFADEAPDEGGSMLTGAVEIPGEAEEISKKICEQLAGLTFGSGGRTPTMGSAFKVTERTAERILFEPAIPGAGMPAAGGEFKLEAAGGTTRVSYRVDLSGFAGKMRKIGLAICFIFGLPAVTVLPAMLFIFVASHSNQAVRWQSFQSLQMIHGLWPPFLFGFIYRKMRQMTAASIDTMLTNLSHAS